MAKKLIIQKEVSIGSSSVELIGSMIYIIRGQKVMLDFDLAALYGVETKRLNEQVKRNASRFPKDFMFRLSNSEKDKVVANCDHLQVLKFSHVNPFVFTEQGVAMLSSVLNSEKAIQVNIAIMRTFTRMREMLASNKKFREEFEKLKSAHGDQFKIVFKAIKELFDKFDSLENVKNTKELIGFNQKYK